MKFSLLASCRVRFMVGAALSISIFAGCTGGSEEVIDTVTDTVEDLTEEEKEFHPACGIVGESLRESADAEDGVLLTQATVLAPNVVAAVAVTGPVIVKLLSLDFATDASGVAVSRLTELLSGGVYLFQPPEPCSILIPDGTTGTSGQLITPDGIDVAEQLIREGLGGSIVTTGDCGEEMLASCYAELYVSPS